MKLREWMYSMQNSVSEKNGREAKFTAEKVEEGLEGETEEVFRPNEPSHRSLVDFQFVKLRAIVHD